MATEAQQKHHALPKNTEELQQVKDKLRYNDKVHLRKVEELQNGTRREKDGGVVWPVNPTGSSCSGVAQLPLRISLSNNSGIEISDGLVCSCMTT